MFTVIQGGEPPNSLPREWKSSFEKLNEIEKILVFRRHAYFGPKTHKAFGIAMLFTMGAMLAIWLLSESGFKILPQLELQIATTALPFLGGLAIFLKIRNRSDLPETWGDLIDQKLHAYDPVDVEAFRRLQQRVSDSGCFEDESMRMWLDEEHIALSRLPGAPKPKLPSFLNKKL